VVDDVVNDTFASWIQNFYDKVYDEGIEEGEIIQILRQQKPKFDPWTETGYKKRKVLREERARQREAEEQKLRNLSSQQLNHKT
jgi:hypothetical protein